MALTSYSFSCGPHLAGNPVVVVSVNNKNSLAKNNVMIYKDSAGATPIANPTLLDSNGNITFYAVAGTYGVLPQPKN